MSDPTPLQEIRATAKYLRHLALDLAEAAEQLQQHATAAANEHVEEADHLHNEIEAAHRRWWHRILGIRWEVTGWSRG